MVGFAEAAVSFQIAVSYHILTFADTAIPLTVEPNQEFASPSLSNRLRLDGKPIEDVNLATVTADLPSWAFLDSRAISIRGVPPPHFQPQSVSVHAKDIFGDSASITIDLKSTESLGAGDQAQSISLRAVAGQYFSFTFGEISLRSTDNVSADLGNASNWLSFSKQNFTLQGSVPSTLKNETLDLSITAEGDTSKFTTQVKLEIQRLNSPQPTMSSSPSHSSSTTSTKASTNHPNEMTQLPAGTKNTTRHIVVIVLAIVLSFLAVLALIIIILYCKRKRRKRSGVEAQKELSARVSFQTEAVPDTADLPPVVEESRISNDRPRQVMPVQAPHIELPWAPDSLQKAKNRCSKGVRKKNQMSIDSSWGELLVPPAYDENSQSARGTSGRAVQPSDALAVPTPIPSFSVARKLLSGKRLSKQRSIKPERGSRVLSTISNRAIGLPKRFSGAGHGGGVLVPETTASMANRSSWQTTLGSIPQGDTRPRVTALEAFSPLPRDGKENEGLGIIVGAMKPSMRLVEHSSEASESLDMQRQRWHTNRARDQLEGAARFSNAGSSRTPLLSKMPNAIKTPSRTISPTIPENATINSRLSQLSWSKWSGIGPAARAESGLDIRAPAPLFAQHPSCAPRDVSMASSGQFDSALSSDSQWEDEILIAEINDAGERHWLSDADSAAPSPRLPFEPWSSQEEIGQANEVGVSRGARLIDKRKHISVEEENLRRSEKSQAGSFRFI